MALYPPDTFRIRRSSETSRTVEAYGELDLSTGPRLEDVLCTIGVPPVTTIDLDLASGLIDAYAIRCMQRAARKLAARGCALRIAAREPSVRSVLGLVGFDPVVPIDEHAEVELAWSGRDRATRPASA